VPTRIVRIEAWDTTCVLELKHGDGTIGTIIWESPISGVPPGGTTTKTLFLTLPNGIGSTYRYGLTARRTGVAYFGDAQWVDITLTAPPGQVFPPSGSVWISSYRFMELFKPRIDTNWTGAVPTAHYRLRAKFPGGEGGGGIHAATAFNNKGAELDVVPSPGIYYPVTLYWLRYEGAEGYNLLQQGPGSNQTVVITEPSVNLSSFWFTASQRPTVSINQNLAKNYRLIVRVNQNGQALTSSLNNDNRFLDYIPGPGTYDIQTYWERYKADGVTVDATGTPVTRQLTVAADGPTPILDASEYIGSIDTDWDEEGNPIASVCSVDTYEVYVPFSGSLRLTGAGESPRQLWLWSPDWGTAVKTASFGSAGFDTTLQVTPGGVSPADFERA
jgi:hypothetical protein